MACSGGDALTDISTYDIEFRAMEDDAWYSSRLAVAGDELTLKCWVVPGPVVQRFNAGDFENSEAIEKFCQRFRPVSLQLQDSQCSKIIEGMVVCASLAVREDDIRFYDAVVKAVHREKHSIVDGEEECSCNFVLCWKHGPHSGYLTSASIVNICLIESAAQVDSRVASFSKIAKGKLEMVADTSSSVSEGKGECQPLSLFGTKVWREMNKLCEETNQDNNMISTQGNGSYHFILIENLEKDLCPSSILEFIHEETSILAQAYVFPSLSSELYARGVIVLDCKRKFRLIYEFLNSPNHVVISSRGRPWIMTENLVMSGTSRAILESIIPAVQTRNRENELKVARTGTEEYRKAKHLKDLLMEFLDHQKQLYKRLEFEERKILQQS